MASFTFRLEDEALERMKQYAEQRSKEKGIPFTAADWLRRVIERAFDDEETEEERVAYFSDPKNHASLLAGGFLLSDFPPHAQPSIPIPTPQPTPQVRDPYEGCTEEERAVAKVWDERAAKLRAEEPLDPEPEPEDLITSKPPLSYGPSPLTEEERLQEKRGNWRKVLRTPA